MKCCGVKLSHDNSCCETGAHVDLWIRISYFGKSIVTELQVPDKIEKLFYAKEECTTAFPYQCRQLAQDDLLRGCWGSSTYLPPPKSEFMTCICPSQVDDEQTVCPTIDETEVYEKFEEFDDCEGICDMLDDLWSQFGSDDGRGRGRGRGKGRRKGRRGGGRRKNGRGNDDGRDGDENDKREKDNKRKDLMAMLRGMSGGAVIIEDKCLPSIPCCPPTPPTCCLPPSSGQFCSPFFLPSCLDDCFVCWSLCANKLCQGPGDGPYWQTGGGEQTMPCASLTERLL